MTAQTLLEYDRLPSIAPYYLRAATTVTGGLAAGTTIPPITAHTAGVQARATDVARYRKVCGFAPGDSLPVTYPHVLAFALQMAVLTHKDFPLKLLGLIHTRNAITQQRAIAGDEALDITVSAGGHRDTVQGIEFDLVTRMRDAAGGQVWQETNTMLARASPRSKTDAKLHPDKPRKTQKPAVNVGFAPEYQVDWAVPADIGRRYAWAAGDYNPIHLSPWTAKLFGFDRAIATGMWTKARAAAQLADALAQPAYTLAVGFKKPVLLPSDVRFGYKLDAVGAKFALTNAKGDIVHLLGDVRYL